MDAPPPALLIASYRDPMRGMSVAQYADTFEQDITALRAALIAHTIGKPVRFKYRGVSHVVMPWDAQYVGHSGASLAGSAEPEEHIEFASALWRLGDAPLLITSEAPPPAACRGEDDEAFEIALTTPLPASVVVRAPTPEAAKALLRTRWDVLRQDVLESEAEHGGAASRTLYLGDVEIIGVRSRPDIDVGSLPILY